MTENKNRIIDTLKCQFDDMLACIYTIIHIQRIYKTFSNYESLDNKSSREVFPKYSLGFEYCECRKSAIEEFYLLLDNSSSIPVK